jgi:hypothetical protein
MANIYGFRRMGVFVHFINVTEICVEGLRNGIKSLRMRSNLGEV